MSTIAKKQAELVEEFSMFSDWTEKYEYLIDLGKDLPVIDPQYKTEEYLIKGCQSQVWLRADKVDGKVVFTADSDAIITRGIVALLINVLSNETPQTIINDPLAFVDQIGLKEHLSPTRSNGLVSMMKQMKLYALAYQ
ncbi:MAG: SufE family protein [Bacteroidota bacterium]